MNYNMYNNFYNFSLNETAQDIDIMNKYRALDEGYIDLSHSITTINEAKFSIVPKFTENKDLKAFTKEAEEAERLLNDEGIDPKTGIQKANRIIFKLFAILSKCYRYREYFYHCS